MSCHKGTSQGPHVNNSGTSGRKWRHAPPPGGVFFPRGGGRLLPGQASCENAAGQQGQERGPCHPRGPRRVDGAPLRAARCSQSAQAGLGLDALCVYRMATARPWGGREPKVGHRSGWGPLGPADIHVWACGDQCWGSGLALGTPHRAGGPTGPQPTALCRVGQLGGEAWWRDPASPCLLPDTSWPQPRGSRLPSPGALARRPPCSCCDRGGATQVLSLGPLVWKGGVSLTAPRQGGRAEEAT